MENQNPATYSNLYIETEPGEIRAMVFDRGSVDEAICAEFSGGLNVPLLSTHKLFRQSYNRVKLSARTERFSLIPSAFFRQDQTKQLAHAAFSYDESKDTLMFCPLKELETTVLFALEKEITDKLKELFPHIEIVHSSSAFLSATFNPIQTLNLHIQFTPSAVEFALYHLEKLLFYNQFPTHSAEDAAYHILNVCKVLKIETQSVQLKVYRGKSNDELSDWLVRFFPKIEMVTLPVAVRHATLSLNDLHK